MRKLLVFCAVVSIVTLGFADDAANKPAVDSLSTRTPLALDKSWTPDLTFKTVDLSKWKVNVQSLAPGAESLCFKMRVTQLRRLSPSTDEVRAIGETNCVSAAKLHIVPATQTPNE